jgi:hypothetical protein
MSQPVFQWQPRPFSKRGKHSAATVMAAHDDVLHLKCLNRILQHGMKVGVEGRRQIGDVTVHKDLAGPQADDLIGRDAAVGAGLWILLKRSK